MSAEQVAAFLADRDEPCPGCGYNLRGAASPTCPECGRPIELALRGTERGHSRLVALALVWVLVASVIGATRAGMTVYAETAAGPIIMVTSAGGQARTIRLGAAATVAGGVTIRGGAGPAAMSAGSISFTGPGVTARDWSLVSVMTWLRAAWWGGLSLAALIVLIMLWRRRDRAAPPLVLTGVLFGLYAAGEVVGFMREIVW